MKTIQTNETNWKEIYYKPQPIITRIKYGGDKYWLEMNCTIEVVPEDLGFMKYLTNDIKVKITFPDDHVDMYVEPLATLHEEFFNELNEIIWEEYPYPKNRRSHKQKELWRLGGKIHSQIAAYYHWSLNYKDYTPATWVELLNDILEFIKQKPELHEVVNRFPVTE